MSILSLDLVQIQCPSQYINQALLLNSFFKISIYIFLLASKWRVHDIVAFPTNPFAYLPLGAPDNSNSCKLNFFSLEGSSYRESTV